MVRLLFCFFVLQIAGCAWLTDLTNLGENNEAVKPKPLEPLKSEVEIDRLWKTRIGKSNFGSISMLAPQLFRGKLYAASADGNVKALEASNGKELWAINVSEFYQGAEYDKALSKNGDILTGGVGLGEGLLVICTVAGEVLALNQDDGALVWRAKASSEALAPPQVNGDIAVVHTIDGKLTAYNSRNGARRWTYSSALPPLSLRGTATPLLTSQYVIGAFANGRVAILDRDSGLPGFDQMIGISKGRNDLDRLVDVDGRMVLLGQRLYAVGYQSRLIAVDLATLSLEWSREASSIVGLGEGFGNIYVSHSDGVIGAYDAVTGKIVWEVDALTNRSISVPVSSSSFLLVGDLQGYLHVIAQSDGRFVGRRKIDNSGVSVGPISDGGRIYLLANNGTLSAYEIY